MHLLVLGATGPSGLAFLKEALHADHTLTIYARSPSKLPRNIANNPNVQIIQGTFEDAEAVQKSLHTGATVLISFAGPKLPNKGTVSPAPTKPKPQTFLLIDDGCKPVSEFYERTLFPMIRNDRETNIKRCLCCSTPSFQWREDKRSLKWWFLVLGVKMLGGSAYDEVNGIGRVVSGLSDMEWTVFRVPMLTNGETKPVRAGMIGEGQDGIFLSRKSMAVWVLQELEGKKWIGMAPALCNPGFI